LSIKSQVTNKPVQDSAGAKAQQAKAATAKKPAASNSSEPSPAKALSPTDTTFLAFVRDVIQLHARYEALAQSMANSNNKKPAASKPDTFGFVRLRSDPPLKVGLFLNGKPLLDSATVQATLQKNKRKGDASQMPPVPNLNEISNPRLTVDSIQVYLKDTYITRIVLFCGRSVYQTYDRIDVKEIDDQSTFSRFNIDGSIKEIRVNDLFVYAPWHDGDDKIVKEGIYLLSSSEKIILPTQPSRAWVTLGP
jgi:hypothetical protein